MYRAKLTPETQEAAIKEIKDAFQYALASRLRLRRVTAPLFVLSGSGVNDDLNGEQTAVSFAVRSLAGARAEIVHSLAKWKRMKLAEYHIAAGYGLYTDMNAIRADETTDAMHSLYVDQWDWERTISKEERSVDFLKSIVRDIYAAITQVEQAVWRVHAHITPELPPEITFIHAQELSDRYPNLTAKERENRVAEEFGAVFIIGIGAKLASGEPHEARAADYDDYTSIDPATGLAGLNGDIIVWNRVLGCAFELSSMGVRVDGATLEMQLRERGEWEAKRSLSYHRELLLDRLPLSIGGGIGQSRLCMYYLRAAHIGEVQSSLWSTAQRRECAEQGIFLK
ncbi:MAG: aspartate--ammonia ligase [Mucinivorans sp.]